MSNRDIIIAAGYREPEAKVILVTVKVTKITYKDSAFFVMEGNYTESSRIFNATFSIEQANMLKLNNLDDGEEHLLKLKVEFHEPDKTGYVKDSICCPHKSSGWKVSRILAEIKEISAEYRAFSQQNRESQNDFMQNIAFA
jgi:hypothetical protein